MKHGKLHSVAHNFISSIAGGLSFVVPNQVIQIHVFAEAAVTKDGFIVADFLNGKILGSYPDGDLQYVLPLFRNAFPQFCEKHGVAFSNYRELLARFVAGTSNNFIITIEDQTGRRTSREYSGISGKRSIIRDELGRQRPRVFKNPMD